MSNVKIQMSNEKQVEGGGKSRRKAIGKRVKSAISHEPIAKREKMEQMEGNAISKIGCHSERSEKSHSFQLKTQNSKLKTLSCVFVPSLVCALFLITGCKKTSNLPSSIFSPSGETGSLSVQILWRNKNEAAKFAAPEGVNTVRISISAADMTAKTSDYSAAAGTGTMTGVPAGAGRTVSAQGLDNAGACLYSGSSSGVTIAGGRVTTVSITVSSPCAAAAANPTTGMMPLTVNFTGNGATELGAITKYEWDFNGDGTYDYSSETSGNTAYTYNSAGIYNAVFRVTNDKNTKSTKSLTITVSLFQDDFETDKGWGISEEIVGGNPCYKDGIGEVARSTDFAFQGANGLRTWANKAGVSKFSNHIIGQKKLSNSGITGLWLYELYAYVPAGAFSEGQTGPEFSVQSTRQISPGDFRTHTAGIQYRRSAADWIKWDWAVWHDGQWTAFSNTPALQEGIWYHFSMKFDYNNNKYIDLSIKGGAIDETFNMSAYVIKQESKWNEEALWLSVENQNLWQDCNTQNNTFSYKIYYDNLNLRPL